MTLFIANLDFRITAEQLQKLFLIFGAIKACKLITEKEAGKKSKGYGFVSFTNSEAAEWAVKSMNGMDLNGRKITVRKVK